MEIDARINAAIDNLMKANQAAAEIKAQLQDPVLGLLLTRAVDYSDNAVQALETVKEIYSVIAELNNLEEDSTSEPVNPWSTHFH